MPGVKDKKKRTKLLAEKSIKSDKDNRDNESNIKGKIDESYENKLSRKKKRSNNLKVERETTINELRCAADGSDEQIEVANDAQENEKRKSREKGRKHEKKAKVSNHGNEAADNGDKQNDDEKLRFSDYETEGQMESTEGFNETDSINIRSSKSKKPRKKKKNTHMLSKNGNLLGKNDAEEDDVFQISSGDDDFSKGMRKWIMEFDQARPGLTVLQERIDDFITAHDEQEQRERKERETQAAEDGWTVVVHHKGRKKTTDMDTGIAVGSVAQAAILDKMAKKKNKDVGLDFYRFQRRESRRNEIMTLQNKFEQDKKRIQQLRAARKFRPY